MISYEEPIMGEGNTTHTLLRFIVSAGRQHVSTSSKYYHVDNVTGVAAGTRLTHPFSLILLVKHSFT